MLTISKGNAPQIEMIGIADLKPRPDNPRTHSKAQIALIAKSIQEFGFTVPILIDSEGGVIAGHARLEAARLITMDAVPAVRIDHLTPTQIRAYVIADNKLAERSDWDSDLLRVELKALEDLDIDLCDLGFETPELDILFVIEGDDTEELAPEIDTSVPAVCQAGDVWCVGPHRLGVGDVRDEALLAGVLGGQSARMVLTDPPYNVAVNGHVRVKRDDAHGEFAFASGEMSSEEFVDFLTGTLRPLVRSLIDGGLVYSFMDWRHIDELNRAAFRLGLDPINLAVWVKPNGGMGSLYRSRHELCAVYKSGKASHINNVELGKHGRYRTNVWEAPGMSSFGAGRDADLAAHPTVKPVALLTEAILDVSRRGEIVLDGFAGSGSTLVAAHKADRIGCGIEIDPRYGDVALNRLSKAVGEPARLVSSGETFDAIAELRRQEEAA